MTRDSRISIGTRTGSASLAESKNPTPFCPILSAPRVSHD
jgi:hypothetical protein